MGVLNNFIALLIQSNIFMMKVNITELHFIVLIADKNNDLCIEHLYCKFDISIIAKAIF